MQLIGKEFLYDIDRVFEFRTAGMRSTNKIVFGCNSIEKIGMEASNLAKGKVLLVIDEVLGKLGIIEKIKSNLEDADFEVFSDTSVDAEPHIETAEAMYEQYLDNDISLMIGVGGGSVMDMTKFLAQCIGNKILPRNVVNGEVTPEKRGIPFILAPTTSGTGSEVSPYSVMTLPGSKKYFFQNPYLYPDISIVDPVLTLSMPPMVTAYTGMDAIAHSVEAMLNTLATPLSDILNLGAIEFAGANLRKAVVDGQNVEARYYMSLASTISMMGYTMSSAIQAHSVSYVLAKYKPTPHGLGCAIGLPYAMAYDIPVRSAKLARIAEALGESIDGLSELEAAMLAAGSVLQLMEDIGLPISLEEYGGIKEDQLEEAAHYMIKNYPRPLNPRPMGLDEAIRFWHNMWEGNLSVW